MENKKNKAMSMTEGNIVKRLLLFSIPLILGNLLQQTYNTVDSVIVEIMLEAMLYLQL